ncbi:MAG: TIGR00269 family protein [archaeon]|nr:MAG: TIGR00269 family protein [archaeon]
MKCYSCGNSAVIYRKYEGRAWCKNHFSKQLESKVKVTIRKNNLIEKGDKICVALSGGKDSCLVLYLMDKFFGKRPDIEVLALSIDEGIKGYRDESIKKARELCKKIGIPLHLHSFEGEFGKTMDNIVKKDARACTYCGVFRRFVINKKARELGATKLATGHNLDDEIQSVFINNLKGDINRLMRLGPRPIVTKKKFVTRIKPLRDVPERETALYDMINGIDYHDSRCPNAEDSIRFDVRKFINVMEEKYPGTKHIAIKHFDTILPALRKHFSDTGKVKECSNCGEPTSRNLCKVCELLDNIKY